MNGREHVARKGPDATGVLSTYAFFIKEGPLAGAEPLRRGVGKGPELVRELRNFERNATPLQLAASQRWA